MKKRKHNELRSHASTISLLFLFSINIFIIIAAVLAITAVICLLLIHSNKLPDNFYKMPHLSWLVFVYITSIVIGITIILMLRNLFILPIQHSIEAMKQLAEGDFNIHIQLNMKKPTIEMVKFVDCFNKTTAKLGSMEMLHKDFMNNFSHEFKTPIVSISGFAKLLRNGTLSEKEQMEYLDIIITEADRLATLSQSVLELSKIESQVTITKKEFFNISEQIRQSVVLVDHKWIKKKIELDMEIEESDFYGNAALIKHIWVNLLDNAYKFAPAHSTISIQAFNTDENYTFQLTDEGPGMSEHTKEHIFEHFFQEDTSHNTQGNGLGMTMVQKVILLHQGRITIRSSVGNGTTMIVTLPHTCLYN